MKQPTRNEEQDDIKQSQTGSPVENAVLVIAPTPESPHVVQQGKVSVKS